MTIRRHRRRSGFTLVEMACATLLMTLLGLLVATAWPAFGLPAVEVYRRGRIAREAALAAAALAADLGGAPARAADRSGAAPAGLAGRLGAKELGRLVGYRYWPLTDADLELWYDGGEPPDGTTSHTLPDCVIAYRVAPGGALVRWDSATNAETVVASDVAALAVEPDLDAPDRRFSIRLTFQHRDIDQTYTFVGLLMAP